MVGGLDSLAQNAAQLEATHAIIALPEATHRERRRIVDLCREANLKVLTIPSFDDLMSGKVQVTAIRQGSIPSSVWAIPAGYTKVANPMD